MPAPLTLAELTAALDRIGGFERQPLVAVAVSGGPDSIALALLADRWAREHGGAIRALTVDHGLRPESAAEAREVATWLDARGIAHETLVWAGDKPRSGVQEAAREARYRLLADWCAANGVLHLMTAHHREDQAETHLIRRRAGSGVDGLAGMSAVRELPGCRLVRPLLDMPRARLAALLSAERQPFLDDPSNRSTSFERGRLRAGDIEIKAVIAETRRCAAARIERERRLHATIARYVSLHPAGFAAIDAAAIDGIEPELTERLLARIAGCIGGTRYPPRRERVARLRAALVAAPERARTLGGCRFVPWRGRILVVREQAAAAAPMRLEPGAAVWWDRRFAVHLPSAASSPVMLGYLGQFGKSFSGLKRREEAGGLPRILHAMLPAARDENGGLVLAEPGAHDGRVLSLALRPANPLTDAGHAVV